MQAIRNRFNSVVLVLIALMLAGALARGVLGGPLDPPAPPGPTQPQVEPRSPIPPVGWNGTFPITISQPGSYYLTGDITGVDGQGGIAVSANDVTLDLNGFTLAGVPGSGSGIFSEGWNTTVLNGSIIGWGYRGLWATTGANAHAARLQVRSNGDSGIVFSGGQGSIVEDCTASNNGWYGIDVSGNGIVRNNVVAANGQSGISAYGMGLTVEGNSATSNTYDGIYAENVTAVRANSVANNGGIGIEVWGAGVTIEDNEVVANVGGGILVQQQMGRIEGNTAVGNQPTTIPFGIRVTGQHNIVARNTATYNIDNFDIAAGNTAGPEETSTATGPWSNVNY